MSHPIGICSTGANLAGNEFQLFPAGTFRTSDTRPNDVSAWRVDRQIAARLIEGFNAKKNPMVVDYEHQTQNAARNGQPAPAAGWVHGLEWREGKGLYAVDVKWTEAARESIRADQYRFISPVFQYDRVTGNVVRLVNAALTNNPALDGMESAIALRLEFDEQAEELATLRAERGLRELDDLVGLALAECRLLPWQETAARTLGAVDIVALKTVLNRPPVVRPGQTQSEELGLSTMHAARTAGLNEAELRICELTGRSPEDFAALKLRFEAETQPYKGA